jgi:hypothetical protein
MRNTEAFHVLVLKVDLVGWIQVCGEGSKTERGGEANT